MLDAEKLKKEANWIVERLIAIDTLSRKEILIVCKLAAALAKQGVNNDN